MLELFYFLLEVSMFLGTGTVFLWIVYLVVHDFSEKVRSMGEGMLAFVGFLFGISCGIGIFSGLKALIGTLVFVGAIIVFFYAIKCIGIALDVICEINVPKGYKNS